MIKILDVSKRYGGHRVLSGVTFDAPDGMVTGFVGPNGAGKTTLLKIVAGVAAADSGSATIDGVPFAGADRPASTLGVFLSASWIPPRMTARSYLRYLCDVQAVAHRRADDVIETVGLGRVAGAPVKTFSLGMRQRLGIGAAFLTDPRNIILDEPVNGLDPEGIQWFRSLIGDFVRSGRSVLLSSHHMAELSLVADKVVLLDQGRVTRSGDLKDFVASGETRTYVESNELDQVVAVLRAAGFDVHPTGDGAAVRGARPEDVGRIAFSSGLTLSHLSAATRSLEETYFASVRSSMSIGARES